MRVVSVNDIESSKNENSVSGNGNRSRNKIITEGPLKAEQIFLLHNIRVEHIRDNLVMESKIIDVLIVGAGPVGLFLANELARHGVTSIKIIEKLPAISTLSKAVALHARSLEIVPSLAKFLEQGTKCHGASIYDNSGKRLAKVRLDEMRSEYQFALMLPQDETEGILNDHLVNTHNISVARNMELLNLTEFTRSPNGESGFDREEKLVRAAVKNLITNTEEVVVARYVIGCDGARSIVRKTMQEKFIGVTVKGAWITADICVQEEDFPPTNEITGILGDGGFFAFFPLKEKERRFRIAVTVDDSLYGSNHQVTLEELQKLVDGPAKSMGRKVTFCSPRWLAIFSINERRIAAMRKSHLFVCGDAAHVHSPAGGQGMNTGMQDAHNLAWKLALVLKGHGQEDILFDSFAREREENADKVLKSTANMRTLISSDSKVVQTLRNTLLPIVSEIGFVRESLTSNMGEMDIAYPHSVLTSHYGEPRGFFRLFKSKSPSQFLGGRLPYFHLTRVNDESSRPVSSHDLIRTTTTHHVFVLDDEGSSKSVELLTQKLEVSNLTALVDLQVISDEQRSIDGVSLWWDNGKEFHKAFHLEDHSKGIAVLVRPDGYIGFIGSLELADIDALVGHLKSYLV